MTVDWLEDFKLSAPEHVVMPGEFYCVAEQAILSALLGSCVAVCLWDRRLRLGGMTHFVLPHAPEGQASGRYGDVAIRCLRDGLARLGAQMEELRAKVFGGADVLAPSSQPSVGAANVRLALECLRDYAIPVMLRRTGGKRGRWIKFHTGVGEVLVRPIPASRVIHGARTGYDAPR